MRLALPLILILSGFACTAAQAQTAAETRAIANALAAAGAHHQGDAFHEEMPSLVESTPAPEAAPPAPVPPAHDMSAMDHSQMAGMSGMDHAAQPMTGALGPYSMNREASGTAWQPDATEHTGVMTTHGPWMLMGHAMLNAVYDWQQGPRGAEKTFLSGMVMGMAMRSFASGDALQFRAMLSPEPFMGKRGYPVLLATGETANGVDQLTDRQHPHDLFMELSASYSHKLSGQDSVFLYAGLPGEPAFGPPAFMHRQSIMDSPEAPISHHWLDSTHIVYGVVTAGYVHNNWKVEVSRYKGREPDETRFDIDHPKLDSTAVRLSWNPTKALSLQGSWAYAKSPEQLEPDANQKKRSLSAIYTVPFGAHGWWSTTLAWGRRSSDHQPLDAYIAESAIKPNEAWTVFARGEVTQNNELVAAAGRHGPAYTVGKVSLGAIRDFKIRKHLKLGVGGLYAWNALPKALDAVYGPSPNGAMGFLRLKID